MTTSTMRTPTANRPSPAPRATKNLVFFLNLLESWPIQRDMAAFQSSGALRLATSPSAVPEDGDPLDALVRRRDEGEELPAPIRPLDLSGQRFVNTDLSGLDLSNCIFGGCDLSGSDLRGARLVGASLEGAILHGARLDDAELLGAKLASADFSNASAARTGFGRSSLEGASFFEADLQESTFSGADLRDADFRVAKLDGSRAVEADVRGACFDGASLRDVDLTGVRVAGASFTNTDLRAARVRGIKDYAKAEWQGADIRDVDFAGAWLLRRHVLDENFIAEFRGQSRTHEWLYRLWWVTSDCGRSIGRWTAWTVLIAVVYAGIYTVVDIDYGAHETWLSPIYYSVVTFSTLGYGDVLPSSAAAQATAMSEVILGYVGLGGLLSILADKMARRAG